MYLIVALVAVLALVSVVLWFAKGMGTDAVRIKASLTKMFTFEISLGSDDRRQDDDPTKKIAS